MAMASHARIATDPIHPMLVEFPIVLYSATVVALLGHAVSGEAFWYRAAMYASCASIVIAVVAVVPAIVDLIGLSSTSRWRRLGLRHAACNVAALVAFSAAGATIYSNYSQLHHLADFTPLALTIAGLAAAIVAAWIGWSMVASLGARLSSLRDAVGHELVLRLPSPRRTHS
ncbi:MAG TPA: DUF2231 domain-containing protein [Kofleriaceae bacterium]|jgi:uncharacterized membrane protein